MPDLKRIGLLLLIVLVLTDAACSAPAATKKTEKPPPPAPAKVLEVRFGISAPFSNASLTINAEGKLVYTAEVYPPAVSKSTRESKTIQITNVQLEALHALLTGSNLFELGGNWNIPGQDCIGYGLSVKTSKGGKSFSCSCGCPDELNPIQDMLFELLGHPMVIMGF